LVLVNKVVTMESSIVRSYTEVMNFNCYIRESSATLEIKPLQTKVNRIVSDNEGSFTMALFDNTFKNILSGNVPLPQKLNIRISTDLGDDTHLQVRTCWGTPQ